MVWADGELWAGLTAEQAGQLCGLLGRVTTGVPTEEQPTGDS